MAAADLLSPADVSVIAGLRISPLAGSAVAFAPLGFPRLAPVLERLSPPWVAVGATIGGLPVGLALGQAGDGVARLLSLKVARSLRNRGIGRSLAAEWERTAAKAGATSLRAGFSDKLPQGAALAATLSAAGWTPPRLTQVWTMGEAARMVEAVARWPSVAGRLRDPEGFSFESWRSPDVDDRAAIAALAAEPDHLPLMHPDLRAERIEPACSIAVRRQGVLVGWVLAERTDRVPIDGYRDRPAIDYRSAYLARHLWHTGVLVGAYWHAYARQVAAFGPTSIAMFGTIFPRMMALVRRRFAPISLRVDETFEMTREIALGSP
ncbi:GNAT family N-acetyltransferase [Azospirillum sp. YIM B02556]|uniref:GNAT family N-acetyltransferase n=1 Tax=Azospirillum endophyticum TaxID=2800326 RepID=A0ABS1F1J2_9PROT|nr:GNAT family N-acetyltransferase [Azospirillum endophyticum]MBK1837293.1 GNAT family N-acetyltransferase [Azospirillum endophyticum]